MDNMDDSFIYVDQKKLIDFADINSIIIIEDGPLSFIVKDKGKSEKEILLLL